MIVRVIHRLIRYYLPSYTSESQIYIYLSILCTIHPHRERRHAGYKAHQSIRSISIDIASSIQFKSQYHKTNQTFQLKQEIPTNQPDEKKKKTIIKKDERT